MGETLQHLGIAEPIIRELTRMGITTPTAVQAAVIPDGVAGRDIIACAPTGTGKTLAFAVPMVAALADGHSLPGRPRGVVLCPTRELAHQVTAVLADLGRAYGLRVLALVGGEKLAVHQRCLAAPADIVVLTPGRAGELINTGLLRCVDTTVAVIDEADELADKGFLPAVNRVLNTLPASAQLILCSATLGPEVAPFCDRLRNPVHHSVAEQRPQVARPHTGAQHILLIARDNAARNEAATWLAARRGRTIIFVAERSRVGEVQRVLSDAGVKAGCIHGRRGHTARAEAVRKFIAGDPAVLIATDVAARGLDVDGVGLVVHMDPAADAESYVHRSGRTARAGRSGVVVTLLTPHQLPMARAVVAQAGVTAVEMPADLRLSAVRDITGARRPPRRRRAATSTDSTVGAAPKTQRKVTRSRRGIPTNLQVGLDGNIVRPRVSSRRGSGNKRHRPGGSRRS